MRRHSAHDEMQVVVGDVVLVLVAHHLECFFFAAITAGVMLEGRLYFPVMNLVPMALVVVTTRMLMQERISLTTSSASTIREGGER